MEKQKKLDMNVLRKEKQDLENILSGIDSRGEEVINTRWQINKKIGKIEEYVEFSKMTME